MKKTAGRFTDDSSYEVISNFLPINEEKIPWIPSRNKNIADVTLGKAQIFLKAKH